MHVQRKTKGYYDIFVNIYNYQTPDISTVGLHVPKILYSRFGKQKDPQSPLKSPK